MVRTEILAAFLVIFPMSIVLNQEMIREAIPIGADRQVVEAYFEDIDANNYAYYPRSADAPGTRTFPWTEEEVGVLNSGAIFNVRTRWWLPSVGAALIIRVGISEDDKVTQVEITGGRTGWP